MRFKRLFLILITLPLVSCGVYKATKNPGAQIRIPALYSYNNSEITGDEEWWHTFNDSDLNRLIDKILVNSPDIIMAWSRLAQVMAISKQKGAAWWPNIMLKGGNSRARSNITKTDIFSDIFSGGLITDAYYSNRHYINLEASYEIDLWGKIASLDRAAKNDFKANRLDLETIVMTITAQAAELWYTLIEQQIQLKLINKQLENNILYTKLIEMRFANGIANSMNVLMQRLQVANLKAKLPLTQSSITTLKHQINLLLGRTPNTPFENIPGGLPDIWEQPAIGIPSDLLTKRPDVKAAQLRIIVADNRVGAAVANLYPSFKIFGSTGYVSTDYSRLLERWVWSIGDSIAVTLFDGHRKNQEIKLRKAIVEERLENYKKTILTALKEVEGALMSEDSQKIYIKVLIIKEKLARATFEEARQRYINGLDDYLNVLNAIESLQIIERELINAKHGLILWRIRLCRALGGTWTQNLKKNKKQETRDIKGEKIL